MNDLFIQNLKSKVAISSVVSRYVRLTYKGGHYTGLCPFHKEKSPSFTVNDAKGFYHCFGCNASGDAISFLQNYLSISFSESVSELCLQTNTPLPTFQKQENNAVLNILEQSLIFMQEALKKSTPALDYLKKREINQGIIEHFAVGFMPNGKDSLFKHLQPLFSSEDIIKSGMCIKSTYNSQIIDRFQNRIIFPIHSYSGSVIGFSGRIFNGESDTAKYINSPETDVFKKSHVLYNFHNARKTKERFCIVTEGFMDTIAFYKDGITNVVAQMGTAFTKHHLTSLLARFEEVVFCLDGDTAGKRASEKIIEMLFETLVPEKKYSFIEITEGKDPDEHLLKNGKGSLKALAETRIPLHEYAWVATSSGLNLKDPAVVSSLEQRLIKIVRLNPEKSIQTHYEYFFKNKIYQSRFHKEAAQSVAIHAISETKYFEYEGVAIAFLYQYYTKLQEHFETLLMEYEFYIISQNIKDIIMEIENGEDVSGEVLMQEILKKHTLPLLTTNAEMENFYMLVYNTSMLHKLDAEIKASKDFGTISFLIAEKNKIALNIKNYTRH